VQEDNGNVATTSNNAVSSMSAMLVSGKTLSATQHKIGFLGLGIMGSALVGNLLITGHNVTVWNRTSSKVRLFRLNFIT
jgi:glutamyl-tRNA reductase